MLMTFQVSFSSKLFKNILGNQDIPTMFSCSSFLDCSPHTTYYIAYTVGNYFVRMLSTIFYDQILSPEDNNCRTIYDRILTSQQHSVSFPFLPLVTPWSSSVFVIFHAVVLGIILWSRAHTWIVHYLNWRERYIYSTCMTVFSNYPLYSCEA